MNDALTKETGRAGRDGKTSICLLFYSYSDTRTIFHLIDQGEGTYEQKEYNRANLRRVVQFCLNLTDCRRSQVLQYFGERFPADKCHKTCDNCLRGNAFEQRDVTELAKNAVELVESVQLEKGMTIPLCVAILKGSKTKQVRCSFPFSCYAHVTHGIVDD
jgi:superfamily II DNA helicase RecQ